MKELSERQQAILEFIEEFIDEHNYPPTVRDIQTGCGISSTSVVKYNLDRLTEGGYLNRDSDVSRGLALAGGPGGRAVRPEQETAAIPLMGTIAAGEPFPMPENDTWSDPSQDMIDLPQAIIGRGDGVYALRVRGDSMIDALIADGDLVVMEQTDRVAAGEMAAVRLKDENTTTLKYFFPEGVTTRLQPANTQMDPISVPSSDVEVLSKVLAVWRYMG